MYVINYIEELKDKINNREEISIRVQSLIDSIENYSLEYFYKLYNDDKEQVGTLFKDIIDKLKFTIGWLKQTENYHITNIKILEVAYLQLWVVIRSVFELRFNTKELYNKKFILLDNVGNTVSFSFDQSGKIENKQINTTSQMDQFYKDQKKCLEEKLKIYIEKSYHPEESYFINFLISIYHIDKSKDFNHYRKKRNNHPLTHRKIDSPIEKFELSANDFDKLIDLIIVLLLIKKM